MKPLVPLMTTHRLRVAPIERRVRLLVVLMVIVLLTVVVTVGGLLAVEHHLIAISGKTLALAVGLLTLGPLVFLGVLLTTRLRRAWQDPDITERKRDEHEFDRSREMLRLIINNIPQHVFWKDRESRYLGCNALFAQAAGLPGPSAIIGKTDFDLSWRKTAELYQADDRFVMETNSPKLKTWTRPRMRPAA